MVSAAAVFGILLAAPTLTMRDLPLVSDDGATVAVPLHDNDGGRGNPNLALGLLDASSDRVVRRLVVVDADDPARPGRAQREAAAEAVLASGRWTPLTALRIEEDPGAPMRSGGLAGAFRANRAAGTLLTVEYREPVLVVRDAATGRELLRRSVPSWSQPGGPRCRGCIDCPRPLGSLEAAWTEPARHVLLVRVGYHGGTDLCWEPSDTFHVVHVP
jgi:hypothetical protein